MTVLERNIVTKVGDWDANPVYVSRPLLPDLHKLMELASGIWQRRQLTNEGPLHNQLEAELQRFLNVPVAKLFANGTIALICALRALNLPEGSEIITTPLTFAATAHAITFCGYKPVFADVLENELTLDPAAVESAVTPKTSAVLAVHIYGTICDVAELQRVCDKHQLKLVYDAAHAFGAELDGVGIGEFGDLSVFSLHATKLFHTFEGGLITTNDASRARSLGLVRNFGIVDETAVEIAGINGKQSELHAAIGLLTLPLVEAEQKARRSLRQKYNSIVSKVPGLRCQLYQGNVRQSEQYYPLVVDPIACGCSRDDLYNTLKTYGIFSRRYFWPICTDFDVYRGLPIHSTREAGTVVDLVKNRLLCLPFHSAVSAWHVDVIAAVLQSRI